MPDALVDQTSWSLTWTLSEVDGLEYVTIATESGVLKVDSAAAPTTMDVRGLATIRTNADGEAEWEIGSGPAARRGAIPWWQPR